MGDCGGMLFKFLGVQCVAVFGVGGGVGYGFGGGVGAGLVGGFSMVGGRLLCFGCCGGVGGPVG